MLKQMATPPELGTANAFVTVVVDKIGWCGARETIPTPSLSRGAARLQRYTEAAESIHQPKAGGLIRLFAHARSIGPDQGIGEPTGMENGSTAARATDHLELAGAFQGFPFRREILLMVAQ